MEFFMKFHTHTITLGASAILDSEQVEAAIIGTVKVYFTTGEELNLSLKSEEQIVFKNAQHQKYLLVRDKKPPKLIKAFTYWCAAVHQPFLYVQIRHRTAVVILDMIHTPFNLTQEAVQVISALFLRFRHADGDRFGWYPFQ